MASRSGFCVGAAVFAIMSLGMLAGSVADEPADLLAKVEKPPAIRADEAMLGRLDLTLARESLDQSALHWQKTNGCMTCHTTAAYMMARPALAGEAAAHQAVRRHLETMVQEKWAKRVPGPAFVVATACSLAIHDSRTTGGLHPATRAALDTMWEHQRADGGFDWIDCGWAPMEIDDHYGVTFAAVGVGSAPEEYAKTPKAQKGLEGIRRYLRTEPAPSAHHRAMLLWASLRVEGILTDAQRAATLDELFSLQTADGGWAVAGMLADWPEFERKDDKPVSTEQGDAYGTGMVIWLAVEAGVRVSDPRIQRGLAWLKTHQRESGRWFTPSPTKDSRHYISNAGTAWAVLALGSCGEIPADLASSGETGLK